MPDAQPLKVREGVIVAAFDVVAVAAGVGAATAGGFDRFALPVGALFDSGP
jgi:hypothetical protein